MRSADQAGAELVVAFDACAMTDNWTPFYALVGAILADARRAALEEAVHLVEAAQVDADEYGEIEAERALGRVADEIRALALLPLGKPTP